MKILYSLIILSATLFLSCKKTEIKLSEKLLLSENGWNLQSMSIYNGAIGDPANSSVQSHYKQVGNFLFTSQQYGIYSYNDSIHPFTWSISDDILTIDIEDQQDYNSPYLYFYFSGITASPFTSNPGQYLKYYRLNLLNKHTIQMRFGSGGLSSQDNFGEIEIILTTND
ncbi:hypothetical protein DNU06_09475 [Putridiphycobacter roseus]|uniref:Uncharacterized protein n=1 Tax=Putridiphycobacter roseus TaxID=2219161 RepID=A0A2W1N1Z5_9FLAO|nr:hypothetical protein [Putridiphycobacter roseus]PZE16971.1 hypothetical protein DNU06_09475 [Putridiphycobacter roseus]